MIYFLADFGHYTKYGEPFLYKISELFYNENPELILFGGDNFYPGGIIDSNKSFYEKEFKKYFNTNLFKMYGILGNHDYMGNIKYQINNSNLFNMQNNYYIIKYNNYDIYMIDTQILSPYVDNYQDIIYKNIYTNNNHNMHDVLQYNKYKQLEWLNFNLQITKNKGKIPIIVGHYPVNSNGVYKDHNNNNKLYEVLLPLFLKYRIPLYISGHDHISEITEHNILNLKNQFNTCTDIDPIVYFLNKNLKYQLNDINDNYKLVTVISGSSVDLYTKNTNELYNNPMINFYNDNINLILRLSLELDFIKLDFIDYDYNIQHEYYIDNYI
jgi:hypothetical protein